MGEIQEIRQLIGDDLLNEAIHKLLSLNLAVEEKNTLISLRRRLTEQEDEKNKNLIRSDDASIKRNTITNSLLQVLSSIENAKMTQAEPIKSFELPIKSLLVYHPKDVEYAEDLTDHLFPQMRMGKLTIFDIHQDIEGDQDREATINKELEQAVIIFILTSPNLYKGASRKVALEVEKYVSSKRVIPIRVSPYDLNGTPFVRLQGLPKDRKAISDFEDKDKVLYEIASSINGLLKKMLNNR